MTHELVDAFRTRNLRLHRTLGEMLDELPVHRTERRGCGYTQATRFLATYVNNEGAPDDASDLQVFDQWPPRATPFAALTALAAGWPHGWRRLDEFERRHELGQFKDLVDALSVLQATVRAAADALVLEESRILVRMLQQILARNGEAPHALPPMPAKPKIGSCSQAEEFFLELAHGRVRRGGSVNVFVDECNRPLLVEKMNLGESHSAMVLAPVLLNNVVLPAGSLCALAHAENAVSTPTAHGSALPVTAIRQARFLRLTTLAVEPAARSRVFSAQMDAQRRSGMLSPDSTTLAELRAFATAEADSAA